MQQRVFKRVPFSYNYFWKKNREVSEYIFELSRGDFYLLISNGTQNSRGGENLQDLLDYFIYDSDALNNSECYGLHYFRTDFYPNYEIVLQSITDWYDVIRVYDIETLDFFLSTTTQDDSIHIFSDDYDLSFFATFWDEYFDYVNSIKKRLYSYQYLYSKYKKYIATKQFILYDTHDDDENNQSLLYIGVDCDKNRKINVKTIKKYFDKFILGETYNYYVDELRYMESDIWVTTNDWIDVAEYCIENKINMLQALEILIKEKRDDALPIVEKFLTQWYKNGAYDYEYYFELIVSMPQEFSIRKNIVEDYNDFLEDYSSVSNHLLRKSLIRNDDKEFCNLYGVFLENFIQQNKDNRDKIYKFIENDNIVDLGEKAYLYMNEDSILFLKELVLDYLERDKDFSLKILNGYRPKEDEQRLWIVDNIVKIAFFMNWNDILDYLLKEEWYWIFLFDEEYGYDIDNNNNLLIWSQYTQNDILTQRVKRLIKKDNFIDRMDAVISLSRFQN